MVLGGIFALVMFLAGNALGAAVWRARGFGLISFARPAEVPASPSRWRGPAARLAGPAVVYLSAVALFALGYRFSEWPTSKVEVVPGYPAEAAGLRSGDRVVEAGGAPVRRFDQLVDQVAAPGPGPPLELVVLRGEQRLSMRLTTDAQAHAGLKPAGEGAMPSWGDAVLGALVAPWHAARGILRILKKLSGEDPVLIGGPLVLRPSSKRAIAAELSMALGAQSALFLFPLLLFSLATQVVAWARGELRAPAPGRG